MTNADLAIGAVACIVTPCCTAVAYIAQAMPGNEAMGPVLSGVAQFGSVALVGALLAWEMVYRGPKREDRTEKTHEAHRIAVKELTEQFLKAINEHSARWEKSVEANTTATKELTAAIRAKTA